MILQLVQLERAGYYLLYQPHNSWVRIASGA